ncbi:MAG: TIGR00730 family Rossman fold protein [Limisphaerales bacterium]
MNSKHQSIEPAADPSTPPRFWQEDPWRVLRIMSEFVDSFETMSRVPAGITLFGSARTPTADPYYGFAVEMGRSLARHGFSVITGGGPGIMEAANKGAAEVDPGLSVGLNIKLPHEQAANPYAGVKVDFRYFFARKVCLAKYSSGFAYFPGGFGTLDEFAELATLVQTHRIPRFPLVFFGSQHWDGLIRWFRDVLAPTGMISPEDLDLFQVTDSVDEAVAWFVEFRRKTGTPHQAPPAFR